MQRIVDIGRRIELVPIDPYFHDITIGLYRQQSVNATTGEEAPHFLVHTYSHIAGAAERIENVRQAMQVLGGMLQTPEGLLYFPCGSAHQAACRRVFLEACKLASGTSIEPRALRTLDKKSKLAITVDSTGDGIYRVTADGEGRGAARRISAIAGGLMKLGEMEDTEADSRDTVAFACAHAHDALVGLLLTRAPNVRVILREEEMDAARGVLSAPSQQV
jgi:hypothetical protein